MPYYSGAGAVEVAGRKVIDGRYSVSQDWRNGGTVVVEDERGNVLAKVRNGRIDTDRMPAVLAVRSATNA